MTNEKINAALVELQGQLPRITKDLTARVKSETKNIEYSYSFADLAEISAQLLPLLSKCGLAFVSKPTLQDGKFVLAYELRHISGEQIDGLWPLPDRGTPQEIGSAITYARRYSLCAVTGVAPADDDRDAIVAEKAARRQRREAAQPKAQAAPAVPPMNADQQKRLQKAFETLGMDAKDARLAKAREIVGRPLKSATEMTQPEAENVIATLTTEAKEKADDGEAWLKSQQPPDGAGVPS